MATSRELNDGADGGGDDHVHGVGDDENDIGSEGFPEVCNESLGFEPTPRGTCTMPVSSIGMCGGHPRDSNTKLILAM